MDGEALCRFFVEAAPSSAGPEAGRPALARALGRALERASKARPEVGARPEAFVKFIAERMPPTDEPGSVLDSLQVEELALCFACLAGSQPALVELERSFAAAAASALGKLGMNAEAREDAMQRALEKLLTGGPDATPKLAQYSGQGSLGGWLRVVVVRTALNAQRNERRMKPRDDDVLASRLAEDADDPEIEIIKDRYRATLAEAVSVAFRQLTSEQRNLLRLYVIDGLTLAELGRMQGVDASTISRWLGKIRANLLDQARSYLLQQYSMRPSECESLMRVVRSGLHLTIERLLETESPDTVDG